MNPRLRISLIVGVGLIAAVGVLEAAGRISGRDAAGKATGLGEGGCAEAPAVPEERPADVRDAIPAPARNPNPGLRADLAKEIVPGRYILRLDEEAAAAAQADGDTLVTGIADVDEIVKSLGVKRARKLTQPSVKKMTRAAEMGGIFTFESDKSLDEIDTAFEDVEGVLYVEPIIRMKAAGQAPNDHYYGMQWHLQTQWMNVPAAWDVTRGSGVTIAVLDSGVTTGGADGLGRVLEGYDVFTGGNDSSDNTVEKAGFSHGTFIASIIAQTTDNANGTAGMAPEVSILPVRVMSWDEEMHALSAESDDMAEGIRWAVDNGADILNLSLGSYSSSEAVRDALIYATDNGVICVAAVGNDGYSDQIMYPAAYDQCIGVGATDLNHQPAYYSNRGTGVDIMAPGGDTTVDQDGDGSNDGILAETTLGEGMWTFSYGSGTSLAAPMVSSLIAMLKAAGVTSDDDIRSAITSTALDIDAPGVDSASGYGEINPVAALLYKPPAAPPAVEMSPVTATRMGRSLRYVVTWGTTVDADTVVTLEDGTVRSSDPTMTSSHRAFVRLGQLQTSATFTFSSTDGGGNTDSETVTITK